MLSIFGVTVVVYITGCIHEFMLGKFYNEKGHPSLSRLMVQASKTKIGFFAYHQNNKSSQQTIRHLQYYPQAQGGQHVNLSRWLIRGLEKSIDV